VRAVGEEQIEREASHGQLPKLLCKSGHHFEAGYRMFLDR
jgi:hypothetical protein